MLRVGKMREEGRGRRHRLGKVAIAELSSSLQVGYAVELRQLQGADGGERERMDGGRGQAGHGSERSTAGTVLPLARSRHAGPEPPCRS